MLRTESCALDLSPACLAGAAKCRAAAEEQPQGPVCWHSRGLPAIHQGELPVLMRRGYDLAVELLTRLLPQLALLHAIGNPSKPLRHTVGTNVAVIVGVGGLTTWPELLSAIVRCLESNDPASLEGALDALYKVQPRPGVQRTRRVSDGHPEADRWYSERGMDAAGVCCGAVQKVSMYSSQAVPKGTATAALAQVSV